MHKWVDQFATKPKFLFNQNYGQNLEITINLHLFAPYFFHVINGTSKFFLSLNMEQKYYKTHLLPI